MKLAIKILIAVALSMSAGVMGYLWFLVESGNKFQVDDCAAYWVDGKKLAANGTDKIPAKSSIVIIRVGKQTYLVDMRISSDPIKFEDSVTEPIALIDKQYERIDCKDVNAVVKIPDPDGFYGGY